MESNSLFKCYWVLRHSEKNFQDLYLKYTLDVLSKKIHHKNIRISLCCSPFTCHVCIWNNKSQMSAYTNAKEGWYLRKNRRNGPCRWGTVQKRLFGDLTLWIGRLSKYQTNKQERLGAGEEAHSVKLINMQTWQAWGPISSQNPLSPSGYGGVCV